MSLVGCRPWNSQSAKCNTKCPLPFSKGKLLAPTSTPQKKSLDALSATTDQPFEGVRGKAKHFVVASIGKLSYSWDKEKWRLVKMHAREEHRNRTACTPTFQSRRKLSNHTDLANEIDEIGSRACPITCMLTSLIIEQNA